MMYSRLGGFEFSWLNLLSMDFEVREDGVVGRMIGNGLLPNRGDLIITARSEDGKSEKRWRMVGVQAQGEFFIAESIEEIK